MKMTWNEEQQKAFAQWVADGLGLSDLQRKVESEFDMRMTYMDVRFLLIDLKLELKEEAEPEVDTEEEEKASDSDKPADEEPAAGGVKVEVDRLVSPGALVSGDVIFSDGVSAKWTLDQAGRLGLDSGDPEYRPTPEDIQAFQLELRGLLEKQGF